jgi:hypothetical protein
MDPANELETKCDGQQTIQGDEVNDEIIKETESKHSNVHISLNVLIIHAILDLNVIINEDAEMANMKNPLEDGSSLTFDETKTEQNATTTSDVKYEQRTNGNRFVCHCGKAFQSKTSLLNHKLTHGKVNQLKCQECGKIFTDTGNKSRHIKAVHKKITHKCSKCEKSFSYMTSLKHHEKMKH